MAAGATARAARCGSRVGSGVGRRCSRRAVAAAAEPAARATAAWRGTAAIRSARSVDAVARWAIDGLVDLYRTGGRARAAVDTLVEAARLPFDQATRRELRLRAAQLATTELGDNAAAIDMYRSVLASQSNDLEVIERLAHLLGVEDRVPDEFIPGRNLVRQRWIGHGRSREGVVSQEGAPRAARLL